MFLWPEERAEKGVQPTSPDRLGHLEVLIHEMLLHLSPEDANDVLEIRCEVPPDPLAEIVPDEDVRQAMFSDEDSMALKD